MNTIQSKLKAPSRFLVTQLLAVGLTIALVVLAAYTAQSVLWHYALGETSRDRLDALDRDTFLTEARMRRLANDMFFLKGVAEAELASNPKAAAASENFRNAVRTMMVARSQYDQVRLLDPSGREIFRVNWLGGQHPLAEVPASGLQDKSDRPYYRETLVAAPDAAVFSPMDLNVEHGQVEQPLKPTMRVSGQIVGPDGKLRGILVLNQIGELFFRELRLDHDQPWRSMLLNGDGFWMIGPSAESEWGFQLPDRKEGNLKTEDPALWEKISASKVGWFEDKGILYCFKKTDPVNSGTEYPPLRMSVQGEDRLHWIFLTKVPNEVVWQKVEPIRKGIWEAGAMALVVLVPLVRGGLRARHRRQVAVEELRKSELLLQMAGQMSKVGAWRVEWRTRQVIWSEEIYRIRELPLDYAPTVEEGIATYAPEHRETVREAFEACLAEGKPFDVEAELITATGRRLWVRVMGQAEHEDGRLQRAFGTMQDITASKQVLLELHESQTRLMKSVAQEQELARRAQAAERAKGEFLAVMSHEIRTPLNGVIGMTSILADTALNELQGDCVHTIQTSGEALLTVINDILDFSKIESGMMNLEKRSFSVAECVEEAVDLFVSPIRKKKLEAAYLITPEVPASLIGDSNRLRQILINLIGNAIKFTERGEIIINVQCQSRDERGFHLLFSVTDTGIGISREGIGKLFQSFQQVDSSMTRRYGGTGLGLAISKRLAELMGGTMWVESELGQGSTFFFSIILEAAPTLGAVNTTEGAGIESASALIVDDNDTNRRMLDAQLKAWGMKTVSVASGRDALVKLAETKFDAVLLDLQMPEMDGVALAREIRKRSKVPLILLSSSGEVQVGEAGNLFQRQVAKPIKQSVLHDALEEVTGGAREKKKSAARQFDHDLGGRQPLRILLAEDNGVNQKVGVMMLARLGYRADLAGNGVQVLEAVEKASYDLILMDVQMPEMDGIEAMRRLREKLDGRCPFISALTAEALEGDRERLLGIGFDGYLSKPLSPEKLQAVLQEVSLKQMS